MCELVCVNVATLAKKLDALLAWGFPVLGFCEVRATKSAQASIGRRAQAQGYSMVWSEPPPSGATFSVTCGGVAVAVASPFAVRALFPPSLEVWRLKGRLLVTCIVKESVSIVAIIIYGFPKSHPEHGTNETLLASAAAFAGELTVPCVLMGDFNATESTSRVIAVPSLYKLWRISGSQPTTKGKTSWKAAVLPIDHFMVNAACLDLAPRASVLSDRTISDHFPILLRFLLPEASHHVWHWPKTTKGVLTVVKHVSWEHAPNTYAEWCKCAQTWLAESCQHPIPDKTCVTTSVFDVKHVPICKHYLRLLSVQRAIAHLMQATRPERAKTLSLQRKLVVLGIEYSCDLQALMRSVETCIAATLQEEQSRALATWKRSVHSWSLSSKQLYAYMRNAHPPKASMLLTGSNEITNSPGKMCRELRQYWDQIENWSSSAKRARARFLLEDRWSLFLPTNQVSLCVTGQDLKIQAKIQKKSAPGCDGWGANELCHLPQIAWDCLIHIVEHSPDLTKSLLCFQKRIPIEKGSPEVPQASDIRPIDICSMVLRIYAAAQMGSLRSWIRLSTHPSQFATHQGAQVALAHVNLVAERVLFRTTCTWAVSLDFSRLFNRLCPVLLEDTLVYLGMSRLDARLIVNPIQKSKAIWRMPANATVESYSHSRGVPQGLSSSVGLAELSIATLLWRLHRLCSCQSIAYVDDVQVITSSRDALTKALQVIWEFTADFDLEIARAKTCLWGTNKVELCQLAEAWGIVYSDHLHCLGAEWCLGVPRAPPPLYEKEQKRHVEAVSRLRRLSHLPSQIRIKCGAILVGVMPMITYVPCLHPKWIASLRAPIRAAIGQSHGAPEVVYNAFVKTSLDPHFHWLLSLLRLWKLTVGLGAPPPLISGRHRKGSRLSEAIKQCVKLGWALNEHVLSLGDCEYRLCRPWSDLKPKIVHHYKLAMWRRLAARRSAFEGLQEVDVGAQSKLLHSLDAYKSSTLIRIWAGAAMTLAHKLTLKLVESLLCVCGLEAQTMQRLLFRCNRFPCMDLDLLQWQHRPAAHSSMCLCPPGLSMNQLKTWKRLCFRAISLVSQLDVAVPPPFDSKNHVIVMSDTEEYAFCARCHITRKSSDWKYVAAQPCHKQDVPCIGIGDYCVLGGHCFRLHWRTWKQAGKRLAFTCAKCGTWKWALNIERGLRVCRSS